MDDRSLYFMKADLLHVVDGDTVDLRVRLPFDLEVRKKRFRLWGIDTPEMKTNTLTLGREARGRLIWLAQSASDAGRLRVQTYLDRRGDDHDDSFGRYLATLYGLTPSGALVNLNEHLVTAGLAVPYFP